MGLSGQTRERNLILMLTEVIYQRLYQVDTLDKCLMNLLISLRRLVVKTPETEVTARKKQKQKQSVHQLGGYVFREKQIKIYFFFIFYFVQAP